LAEQIEVCHHVDSPSTGIRWELLQGVLLRAFVHLSHLVLVVFVNVIPGIA
jgi:hypothetical protein